MEEVTLRQRVAANLIYYRHRAGMTQAELADRLHYSDKSVSKWERGDGLPDLVVLVSIAEIFGVTVNDLMEESPKKHRPRGSFPRQNRLFILLLSVGLVWLVATLVYFIFRLLPDGLLRRSWLCFVAAIPASCIVTVVFACLWWGIWFQFAAVSSLIWSVSATVRVILPLQNMALIFAVSGVLQILVILWYIMQARRIRETDDS